MVQVEVIRSRRRRKTVQAVEADGVLRVLIPATMSRTDEQRWVAEMVGRFERRRVTETTDLVARAATLAGRYRLPLPIDVRWVDNQRSRWASCTPDDGVIRVSSRLAGVPAWVLDYVLVHELAHLVEPRHDRAFWALVNRYRRAERARGFLLAKSMAEPGTEPTPAPPVSPRLSPPEGRAVEDALAAERRATSARIAALTADLAAVVEASALAVADDEHDPEGSTIGFERAQVSSLLEEARSHLERLDRAEKRSAAGTYGECSTCGEAVAVERLLAHPAAEVCVRCAAAVPNAVVRRPSRGG